MPGARLLQIHHGKDAEDAGYRTEPLGEKLDPPGVSYRHEALDELENDGADHRRRDK
jgi:hypothetical protein